MAFVVRDTVTKDFLCTARRDKEGFVVLFTEHRHLAKVFRTKTLAYKAIDKVCTGTTFLPSELRIEAH